MNRSRYNRQGIKTYNRLKKEAVDSLEHKARRQKLSDYDWQAHFEGIALDLLCNLRPKTIGASHKSMIWNTASRIGQLEGVRYQKVLANWENSLQVS